MKWGSLFLLVGLLALWAGLQPASGQLFLVKPGRCPLGITKCIRFEPDRCRRDEECWGWQKCCYSRCALRCVDPVPEGRCPPPPQFGPCVELCGVRCPAGYGCCSNGCGHECMRLIYTEQPRE